MLDYRFTLANERTFLAWIRTSLGLLAAGVAVHTLVQPFHHAGVRRALSLSCIALAVALAAGAYTHWRDVQVTMERGERLRNPLLVPILAAGIAVVSVFAAIATVWP
ncbi:YidH family protein [Nocardia tengchongensis]|uniref:YidH family protein n=1 Tax=Nocardia tengchongensis TaxID=2055889 RepID=UPI00369AB524